MKKLLEEGDAFELKRGHTVYTSLPEHLACDNRAGVWDKMAVATLDIGDRDGVLNTDYLKGEYVVVKTSDDSSGAAHGVHDAHSCGHHVWARKSDNPLINVDFYQTGDFTAVNPDIVATGNIGEDTTDGDKPIFRSIEYANATRKKPQNIKASIEFTRDALFMNAIAFGCNDADARENLVNMLQPLIEFLGPARKGAKP
jgi:hypothetical protein